MNTQNTPLLEVNNLSVYFHTRKDIVSAVDNVDFKIFPGEILGIVGESGCGKSVTSLSLLHLLDQQTKISPESSVIFDGKDILKYNEKELAQLRGKEIAMIFQDPMTSLNPVLTIGKQMAEAVTTHQKISEKEAHEIVLDMLIRVGISSPEKRLAEYPHQLSGGMKQRVMIAMGLLCHPKLLIADEPTTALDVTTQAQILQLIRKLNKELGTSIILITHDMGVVAALADYVLVMYAGRVVEYGHVLELFENPGHPYTKGLLKSIPRLDQNQKELYSIKGTVPNQYNMPAGCKFWPRCPYAVDLCKTQEPNFKTTASSKVRCWLADNKTDI